MLSTVDFRDIQSMPISSRQEMFQTDAGLSMISQMSPAQIASLFPSYYKEALSFTQKGYFEANTAILPKEFNYNYSGFSVDSGNQLAIPEQADSNSSGDAGDSGNPSAPSNNKPRINTTMGDSSKARQTAESYLGRSMTNQEYDELLRATYAEADPGNPTEAAMVAASILNRAKNQNKSVSEILRQKNQFESVTGNSANNHQSSKNFTDGPDSKSQGFIEGSISGILPNVSHDQTDFTAADPKAYGPGDNVNVLKDDLKQGYSRVGGTIFNTAPPVETASAVPNNVNKSDNTNQATATEMGPPKNQDEADALISAAASGQINPESQAVDQALKMKGLTERDDRQQVVSYIKSGGQGFDSGEWCADFVNASLNKSGVKGDKSAWAPDFAKWGQGVAVDKAEDIQKGDVMVVPGADGPMRHVGMATGNTRINPQTKQLEAEMISGNTQLQSGPKTGQHNAVDTTWEPINTTIVRRATDKELPQTYVQARNAALVEQKQAQANTVGSTTTATPVETTLATPKEPSLLMPVSDVVQDKPTTETAGQTAFKQRVQNLKDHPTVPASSETRPIVNDTISTLAIRGAYNPDEDAPAPPTPSADDIVPSTPLIGLRDGTEKRGAKEGIPLEGQIKIQSKKATHIIEDNKAEDVRLIARPKHSSHEVDQQPYQRPQDNMSVSTPENSNHEPTRPSVVKPQNVQAPGIIKVDHPVPPNSFVRYLAMNRGQSPFNQTPIGTINYYDETVV